MSFKNPLNHWRGAELKEPLIKNRALLGKEVRRILLQHPEGMTKREVDDALPNGGSVLWHLKKVGFARVSPWNKKKNGKRGELWFASEPRVMTAE